MGLTVTESFFPISVFKHSLTFRLEMRTAVGLAVNASVS
jgi:hypothetical protein